MICVSVLFTSFVNGLLFCQARPCAQSKQDGIVDSVSSVAPDNVAYYHAVHKEQTQEGKEQYFTRV